MLNTFFSGNLINENTCNVSIFSSFSKSDKTPIKLVINGTKFVDLEIKKQVFLNGLCLYTCFYKDGFVLGNDYDIYIENFGLTPLNMEAAYDFKDFDKKYYYPYNDLGVTYSKEKTTFKIWAPLASKVELYLKKTLDDKKSLVFELERDEFGVYFITIDGDLDGFSYNYKVKNNGIEKFTTDPYAKASSANGKHNFVVDFSKTKIDLKEENLPYYQNYSNAIIYELHVRDFSMDESVPFKNKGKFLAFTETGLKTKDGNKAGVDYLEDLGITHVQLLPIYDYKTVDELNPFKSYNWGYDPQQYFVPEGSYASNPEDPYSRIIECKQMIAAIHEKGIKVNMDVVYNHVYDYLQSSFENVVPGYYFRKNSNGTLCNGSGCGNDFASNKPMVRKLIVDCCKFWITEYGIDGLRFDLMGLLDVQTINQIVKVGKSIKDDFMVYGEGWDMSTSLNSDEKASILNSFKMPQVAFFNDTFRDICKGPNGGDQLRSAGYLTGNTSFIDGFKFVFLSSSLDFTYPKRFINPNQSINYCECHDNFTLFDKVSSVIGINKMEEVKSTINLINAVILISFGIPFFHAGQEFCLSKEYHDNTYNAGDKYNMIRWNLVDQNKDMINYFKSFIQLRKKFTDYKLESSDQIGKINSFKNLNDGLLEISLKINEQDIKIIINPTGNSYTYEADDYYQIIASEVGFMENSFLFLSACVLKPHSVYILKKQEK